MTQQPAPMPSTSQRPAGRVAYFDSLRALAIIAVIMLHSAAWNWYRFPVASGSWEALNWIDSALRFCVPIFFMISGALFLDPQRTVTLASIFRKSLPRLASAFAFWSILFAVVVTFGPGGSGSIRSMVGQIIVGYYHLWFLLALIGLYLITPLLRRIVADRRMAWYFVGLAALFVSVLPLLTHVPLVGKLVSTVLGTMQLNMVLGYSIYFVLGYLLSALTLTRELLRIILALGGVSIIATAVGTSLLSNKEGSPIALLYGYLTPNVILAAVAIFLAAKAWGDRAPNQLGSASWTIRFLSTYSFGIFLVHPLFQLAYQELGLTTAFAHPIISVPALTVIILVPSALVSVLLHNIPRIGKFIS